MHDPWLADHTFVTWFLVAATLFMAAAMAHRCIAFGGRRVLDIDIDIDIDIDAQEAAFLAGGPPLTFYSALGELRGAGAVEVNPDRVLTRTAPLPVDATKLERAVYEATAGGHTAAQLPGHLTVSAALTRIHDELEQAELLLSPSQRAPTRWFIYAELAVVATGVARVAADLVTGTPISDLLKAFVITAIFPTLHGGSGAPHPEPAAPCSLSCVAGMPTSRHRGSRPFAITFPVPRPWGSLNSVSIRYMGSTRCSPQALAPHHGVAPQLPPALDGEAARAGTNSG